MTKITWSQEAITRAGLPDSHQAELWLRASGLRPESISDADLPAVIQRCRDEQEAGSRRYGAGALLVFPLKSGAISVFTPNRQQLLAIVSPGGPPEELFAKLHELSAEAIAEAQARGQAQRQSQVSSVDLSETGL